VQDSGSHELLDVKLEQIAEYVGDPGYIGYWFSWWALQTHLNE
jgi:hypothetical protein